MPPEYRDCPHCGDPVIAAPTSGSRDPRLFDELPSERGRWMWDERAGIMRRYTADTIPDGQGHLPHQVSCPSWRESLAVVIPISPQMAGVT